MVCAVTAVPHSVMAAVIMYVASLFIAVFIYVLYIERCIFSTLINVGRGVS